MEDETTQCVKLPTERKKRSSAVITSEADLNTGLQEQDSEGTQEESSAQSEGNQRTALYSDL